MFDKMGRNTWYDLDFLLARRLVASRISFLDKILSLNLNLLRFWAIRSVEFLSVGFKVDTVFVAMLVKNSLNWDAIIEGSLMTF